MPRCSPREAGVSREEAGLATHRFPLSPCLFRKKKEKKGCCFYVWHNKRRSLSCTLKQPNGRKQMGALLHIIRKLASSLT